MLYGAVGIWVISKCFLKPCALCHHPRQMSSILFPKLEQESSFPLKCGTSFLKIAELHLLSLLCTYVHSMP